MFLNDGDEYEHKETGVVYQLVRDYNGLWYLRNRSEYGLIKTLSTTTYQMTSVLVKYFFKTERKSV